MALLSIVPSSGTAYLEIPGAMTCSKGSTRSSRSALRRGASAADLHVRRTLICRAAMDREGGRRRECDFNDNPIYVSRRKDQHLDSSNAPTYQLTGLMPTICGVAEY